MSIDSPTETSAIVSFTDLDIRIRTKTAEKRGVLNTIKAGQAFLGATLAVISQDVDASDIKTKVAKTKTLAAKYCRDIIKAIELHIRSLPDTTINEIGDRELAIEAFNHIMTLDPHKFIEVILSTIRDQITEEQSPSDHVATSLSFHASLLLGDFNDNWLPLDLISAKLNQIAACLSIIHAATEANVRQEIAQAGGFTKKGNNPAPASPIEAQLEPVFDTERPLPSPGALPTDLGRFIAAESDAPSTLSTIPARKDAGLLALVLGTVAIIGAGIGFTRRATQIAAETSTNTRQVNPITPQPRPTLPIVTPTQPQRSPVATRSLPTLIYSSSPFLATDQTHSPLEEAVRRALLARTNELSHCLADPADAIPLAYGLRRPIVDQIRRAHWVIGNIPNRGGVTISWTDNGRCDDFHVSARETNTAGDSTRIYGPISVVIVTDIATITRNQKLYHRITIAE